MTVIVLEEPSSPGVPDTTIPDEYSEPPPFTPSIVSLNLSAFPALDGSEVSNVTFDPDFKIVFVANDPSK